MLGENTSRIQYKKVYVCYIFIFRYAMIIAACIHDYDHQGVNNAFLATTEHELAIKYNNTSVLEAHSCASGYRIIQNRETDPFSTFTRTERKKARALIIDCVMATDLSHHASLLMEFKKHVSQTHTPCTPYTSHTFCMQRHLLLTPTPHGGAGAGAGAGAVGMRAQSSHVSPTLACPYYAPRTLS